MHRLLFSHSVVSDSLQPHGLQHARLPCPPLFPRACSNSYPLSRWCHPTISSSVVPFSSHLQFCPAWGSFPMSQLFASGGQSIAVSVSASVLPINIVLISLRFYLFDFLAVQGTLKRMHRWLVANWELAPTLSCSSPTTCSVQPVSDINRCNNTNTEFKDRERPRSFIRHNVRKSRHL